MNKIKRRDDCSGSFESLNAFLSVSILFTNKNRSNSCSTIVF